MTIKHTDRAHAYLSASAAKQWLACPPSIKASEGIKDGKPSVFAEEGTFAHELSELYFDYKYEGMTKRKFNAQLKKRKENAYYNEELHEYVEAYVNLVEERINEARARVNDDSELTLMFEQQLDLSSYVPESFGTGDVIVYSGGILEVIDLKFGKGVAVSAIDNPQLRLYGLGAYELFSLIEDVKEVRMSIIQPRLDSYTTETLSVDELLLWADEVVKPRAELAFKGEGDFKPGEHCRFCKIRQTCRARAVENMKATENMKEPHLLTTSELADLLYKVDEIKKWADDIQDYCLDQAVNHNKRYEGFKLVEGRSRRKYLSEDEVLDALISNDVDKEKVTETKLLTISKLEKQLGKATVESLVGDLIVKPQGKITLVPESDKRKAIGNGSAQDDFDVIKE